MSPKPERNAAVVQAFKDGATLTACARQFGVSIERVRQILHKEARARGVFAYPFNYDEYRAENLRPLLVADVRQPRPEWWRK